MSSSSADRAAELRAQADALDTLAALEVNLAVAKTAYLEDEHNQDAKEAKIAAALALREARSLTRTEGVSVGGDAYVVEEA